MGLTRLLAVMLVLLAPAASAATPAQLRALIEQGKPDEAYRLGRQSPEQFGQPDFDFPFGVAAIAAGKAAEGVLALERFLLNFPGHEAARVELARGYYLLGEDARAREEFEAALARRPPAAVARVIEDYLDAIRGREAKYRPAAMAYAFFGGGYDSNPRAGVDNAEISLPVFGSVTVPDGGVRRGDQVAEYGAGFRATAPVSASVTAFAVGSADVRRYPDEGSFDQSTYAGAAGAARRWDRWAGRVGASTSYTALGRQPYRRVHGFNLDGSWIPDERSALSMALQAGRFGYHGANAPRDADFLTTAIAYRRLLDGSWRTELEVSGTYGRERNRYAERQDLSRGIVGTRLAASVAPWPDWRAGAGASWQKSVYEEPDAALQTTREDRYRAGDLFVQWGFARDFALRAEFMEARNDSNLALYEYKRRAAMLRLRFETR